MPRFKDIEEALDVVEEVTERFKEGKDLDDIFYIGYGADHTQMQVEGGLWAYFGWDCEEVHYEKCCAMMEQLLEELRQREEIAEIETEVHEGWSDPSSKGGAWHIRFHTRI